MFFLDVSLLQISSANYSYPFLLATYTKQTGKTMKLFHGHTGPVTRVAVYQTHQGQERLITGSWDKTIRVWDTETKTCLATLKGHTDFVKALAVRAILVDSTEGGESGKRKRVAHELFSASYDGTILHWDLETFQEFRGGAGGPWKGHARGINDLCLTVEEDNERQEGDGAEEKEDHGKEYLYSAGSDGTIRKWDIERGQGRGGHCVHMFKHHETTVYRVIVEAGVEIWSTSADKTAQRLDLEVIYTHSWIMLVVHRIE
jgi:WD40 repeat protein